MDAWLLKNHGKGFRRNFFFEIPVHIDNEWHNTRTIHVIHPPAAGTCINLKSPTCTKRILVLSVLLQTVGSELSTFILVHFYFYFNLSTSKPFDLTTWRRIKFRFFIIDSLFLFLLICKDFDKKNVAEILEKSPDFRKKIKKYFWDSFKSTSKNCL